MQIVKSPYFPESSSPAKVYRDKGLIVINEQEFNLLPDFAQKWVIEHEKGHYYLQTSDELKADEYALRKLALTEKGSLMKIFDALTTIAPQQERHDALAVQILQIASENGSLKAKEILKKAGIKATTLTNTKETPIHTKTGKKTTESTLEINPKFILLAFALLFVVALIS